MRLKIRNATRRSQRDIEEQFNPINLDYIFEEDDPLAQWLQETENPLLDGQDNSEWLDVSDDDDDDDGDGGNGGSGRSTQRQNSSGSGSALSPPSSDEGNDGGGPGGSGGLIQGVGSGHGGESSSHYGMEVGMHGFRDNEDIGEEIEPLPRSSSPIMYRRRGHRSSDENYDNHPVLRHFGGLGLEQQGQSSHTQHYPNPIQPQRPSMAYSPPYHYHPPDPPQRSTMAYSPPYNYHVPDPPQRPGISYSPPYNYHPPDPPLMAHPPPRMEPPPPPSDMFGLFGSSIPHGYMYAESSSSSAPSGNPPVEEIITYFPYGYAQQANQDDEGNYQDPPRHSFWA